MLVRSAFSISWAPLTTDAISERSRAFDTVEAAEDRRVESLKDHRVVAVRAQQAPGRSAESSDLGGIAAAVPAHQ